MIAAEVISKIVRVYMIGRVACLGLVCLQLVGCGTASSSGTIEFGLRQTHDMVQHPTSEFGPDDTLAYVAHVDLDRPVPPNTAFTEYYYQISKDGREHRVMNDTFKLPIPIQRYLTLNSIAISKLYRLGFTAPGKYRVRLQEGAHKLAEGTFTLH